MYGSFEYGSIPYGDINAFISSITRQSINALFVSSEKQSIFYSSEPHITIFISATKSSRFTPDRKQYIFKS